MTDRGAERVGTNHSDLVVTLEQTRFLKGGGSSTIGERDVRGKFRQDYRSNTWKDMHVIEASGEPKSAIITYPPFVTKVRRSRRGSIGTILSDRLDNL